MPGPGPGPVGSGGGRAKDTPAGGAGGYRKARKSKCAPKRARASERRAAPPAAAGTPPGCACLSISSAARRGHGCCSNRINVPRFICAVRACANPSPERHLRMWVRREAVSQLRESRTVVPRRMDVRAAPDKSALLPAGD
eukprot:scaffold7214_cov410-Prasinococcus_capsulatus_cf.AAC.9